MNTARLPLRVKVRASDDELQPMPGSRHFTGIEWPTVCLITAIYLSWGAITACATMLGGWISVVALSLVIAIHSSVQHEVIHGHPTKSRFINELLVFPAIGLLIPYQRFRETHLRHHVDHRLTDPYDDPESNYLDPMVWKRLPGLMKSILRINNTLSGRMVLGPAISLFRLYSKDAVALAGGKIRLWRAYLVHICAAALVLVWLSLFSALSIWQYLIASYLGLSILKIRTFLEHRAFETVAGRIVVVEKQGLLSWVFLNNNFHAVHHAHPRAAWYELPRLYRSERALILQRNSNYCYASYAEVFRKYLFRSKDPVSHPLFKTSRRH